MRPLPHGYPNDTVTDGVVVDWEFAHLGDPLHPAAAVCGNGGNAPL